MIGMVVYAYVFFRAFVSQYRKPAPAPRLEQVFDGGARPVSFSVTTPRRSKRVVFFFHGCNYSFFGGATRVRTGDLLLAKQSRYQLRHSPDTTLFVRFQLTHFYVVKMRHL